MFEDGANMRGLDLVQQGPKGWVFRRSLREGNCYRDGFAQARRAEVVPGLDPDTQRKLRPDILLSCALEP